MKKETGGDPLLLSGSNQWIAHQSPVASLSLILLSTHVDELWQEGKEMKDVFSSLTPLISVYIQIGGLSACINICSSSYRVDRPYRYRVIIPSTKAISVKGGWTKRDACLISMKRANGLASIDGCCIFSRLMSCSCWRPSIWWVFLLLTRGNRWWMCQFQSAGQAKPPTTTPTTFPRRSIDLTERVTRPRRHGNTARRTYYEKKERKNTHEKQLYLHIDGRCVCTHITQTMSIMCWPSIEDVGGRHVDADLDIRLPPLASCWLAWPIICSDKTTIRNL